MRVRDQRSTVLPTKAAAPRTHGSAQRSPVSSGSRPSAQLPQPMDAPCAAHARVAAKERTMRVLLQEKGQCAQPGACVHTAPHLQPHDHLIARRRLGQTQCHLRKRRYLSASPLSDSVFHHPCAHPGHTFRLSPGPAPDEAAGSGMAASRSFSSCFMRDCACDALVALHGTPLQDHEQSRFAVDSLHWL